MKTPIKPKSKVVVPTKRETPNPKQIIMQRKPTAHVEQMLEDAKVGLASQITQFRQRMIMNPLEVKEIQAFKLCVDALEKLYKLESSKLEGFDLSDLSDDELNELNDKMK